LDANDLILEKVNNLLVNGAFKDNLKLRLEEKRPLPAMDGLLEVFDEKPPLPKHLHIAVRGPSLG